MSTAYNVIVSMLKLTQAMKELSKLVGYKIRESKAFTYTKINQKIQYIPIYNSIKEDKMLRSTEEMCKTCTV